MIKMKSHEQELITKKCIATHTNYFINFNKTALYTSALVMKLFNNSKKLHLIQNYYCKAEV